MMHRIYTVPHTRVNEAWNFDAELESNPAAPYRDNLISGNTNEHFATKNLYCDFYKHFALDIVTESVFEYPYAFITEKTIRPIVHKKMFLLVAPAGTLKMLHDYGFKSFSNFINEDYDNIQNPHKRMKSIVNELARISKFSIDDMQKTMLQYKETLQHNYDHYMWLCNNEIEQVVDKL